MAALQTAHLFAERTFAAFDPERVEQQPPRNIDIHRRRNQTAPYESTLLGCEHKTFRRNRIEQRFDAEAISRNKQIPGLGVEDRQRPHAVEARQHTLLPSPPCCENDLGVRLGAEDRAQCLEFAAKLKEIIDLTVKGDHVTAIGGQHRLIAARSGIDDGQPPVTKGDISLFVEPVSITVRTTMR
jgi:hypothetical protein